VWVLNWMCPHGKGVWTGGAPPVLFLFVPAPADRRAANGGCCAQSRNGRNGGCIAVGATATAITMQAGHLQVPVMNRPNNGGGTHRRANARSPQGGARPHDCPMRFGAIVPAAAPSGGALFVRSYLELDEQQLLTAEDTPARRRVRRHFLSWNKSYSSVVVSRSRTELANPAMHCPDLSGRDGRVGRCSSAESGLRSRSRCKPDANEGRQGLGGAAMVAELVVELLVVEVLFVGFGVSGNMVRALERMAAGNMSKFASNSVARWVFAPGCDNSGDTLSTASGFVGCGDRMRF